MKKLFTFLFFSHLAIAQQTAPPQPRWQHLQDKDGRILATVDNKDGSIEYKEDPKKVVEFLISALRQQLTPPAPTPAAPAVEKKTKPLSTTPSK